MDLDLMFPHAMNALRGRLERNEPRKKGKWRRQNLQAHIYHLGGHFDSLSKQRSDDDHLAGVAIRAIMALEIRALTANGGAIESKRDQS